jgi:hypothetical protein
MSDDEFGDFAAQMRLLVAEESFLWELPAGSRDLLGDGRWRHHGPWRQEDCAAAMKLWFDAGWLALMQGWSDRQLLPSALAPGMLASPQAWVLSGDGSRSIAVVATEVGEAVSWSDWVASLSALRGQ